MEYSDCAICENTCKSIGSSEEENTESSTPGCICSEGLYRTEEDTCVEIQDCSCYYNDKMYDPGEKIVEGNQIW